MLFSSCFHMTRDQRYCLCDHDKMMIDNYNSYFLTNSLVSESRDKKEALHMQVLTVGGFVFSSDPRLQVFVQERGHTDK